MNETISVIGPGAVGLALTAGFRSAGKTVALMARTKTAEKRLLNSGFLATTSEGRSSLIRGGLVSARHHQQGLIAAFFCVKSRDAANAAAMAKAYIGAQTPVIALQNGLGHEKVFRRIYGAKRTVMGVCYFAADRLSPGTLKLNGGKDVLLAKYPGNELALKVATRLLKEAGFKVHIKESETGMLWTKAAFNAAVNPLGAVCAVESGKLTDDQALREISLKALAEAVSAAKGAGHKLDYSDMAEKLLLSGKNAPRQRNSMLQDLVAGRKTEANVILGPFLACAKKNKIPIPTLQLLSNLICHLEKALCQ